MDKDSDMYIIHKKLCKYMSCDNMPIKPLSKILFRDFQAEYLQTIEDHYKRLQEYISDDMGQT